MNLQRRLLARCITLSLFLALVGCADKDDPAQGVPTADRVTADSSPAVLAVPLLHTWEAREFAQRSSSAFNHLKNTVSGGGIVELHPREATPSEVRQLIRSKEPAPFLWLARSSYELEGVKAESSPADLIPGNLAPTDVAPTACTELFSTSPVFVFRAADSFLFDADDGALEEAIISGGDAEHTRPEVSIVIGDPDLSPSGLAALAHLSSRATHLAYADLRAELLATKGAALKQLMSRITHRFARDETMLAWLASREGGLPLLAVSTHQQVLSFSKSTPQAQLREIEIAPSPLRLNYPLCVLDPIPSNGKMLGAARLAHSFLSSSHTTGFAREAGFSERALASTERPTPASNDLAPLVRAHRDFASARAVSLVIDTSVHVEQSLLDSVRLEIAAGMKGRRSSNANLALMSCSITPEILVRAAQESHPILAGLKKMRSSGGFAFRDCLLKAVEMSSDNEPQQRSGSTIILITRGRETSSVVELKQLQQLVPQRLTRNRTLLYIVSIGNEQGDNAEFNARARTLGALVIPTTPSQVTRVLKELLLESS